MAEHNFMYARSRETLAAIAAKSWRFSFPSFSFSSLFRRSPRPAPTSASAASASTVDRTRSMPSTGCRELDDEIFGLGREARDTQMAVDRTVAARLNEAEYAAANQLLECQCCFGDFAWEDTVVCADGHLFCHSCLVRSVQESVYGQGQSVLASHCSVRCLSSSAEPPCTAGVSPDVLRAVLPDDIYNALQDRTASESLEKSGLKLVRCPFCGYAEADELQPYRFKPEALAVAALATLLILVAVSLLLPWLLATIATIAAAAAAATATAPSSPSSSFSSSFSSSSFSFWKGCAAMLLVALTAATFLSSSPPPSSPGPSPSPASSLSLSLPFSLPFSPAALEETLRRIQLRRRGALFRCASPRCERESCIACSKEWAPFHRCFEREEDAARIYVERAMADAVKRTCPCCNLSFIKSDGCNKLTCPCGYVMCYVCRADIRADGYKHFCQHFRHVPGTPCSDCDACDLYAAQDDALAIRLAARAAEQEYWARLGPANRPRGSVGQRVGAGAGRQRWWEGGGGGGGCVEEVQALLDAAFEWAVDRLVEFSS